MGAGFDASGAVRGGQPCEAALSIDRAKIRDGPSPFARHPDHDPAGKEDARRDRGDEQGEASDGERSAHFASNMTHPNSGDVRKFAL
jgi:hypothetical protein